MDTGVSSQSGQAPLKATGGPRIGTILMICLALRVGMLLLVSPWSRGVESHLQMCNDSPLYHLLACNLLDGKGFASDGTGGPPSLGITPFAGRLDDLRTPGYPLFIAAIYGIFGRVPWGVVLVQIVLSTLTCWLLYAAVARMINARVAAYAALLFALDPFSILYSSYLLSETLFVWLLVLSFYLYAIGVHGRYAAAPLVSFIVLGGMLGLLMLTRPVAQFLPLVMAVLLLLAMKSNLRAALPRLAVFLIACGVVVAPWLIRNQRYFGVPKLTYIGSWDLLALDVGLVEATRTHQDVKVVIPRLFAEADSLMVRDGRDPRYLTNLQKAAYWERVARHYAMLAPLPFALQAVKGMVFGFINLGTSDFAIASRSHGTSLENERTRSGSLLRKFIKRKSPLELLFGAYVGILLLVTYVLTLIGLIAGWRRMDRVLWWLCLTVVLYFVVITGAFGMARLKLPTVPFYLVFAAVGLAAVMSWRKKSSRRLGQSTVEPVEARETLR